MQFIELEYYLYKKARGDQMDLKQIRYFLEVVDQGSDTASGTGSALNMVIVHDMPGEMR